MSVGFAQPSLATAYTQRYGTQRALMVAHLEEPVVQSQLVEASTFPGHICEGSTWEVRVIWNEVTL